MGLGADLWGLRRRWTAPVRARALDVSIAGLWLAIVVLEAHDEPMSGQLMLGVPLVVAQGLALLVRRSRPVLVLAIVLVVDFVGWTMLREVAFDAVSLPGLIALYSSVGKYRPYRVGWIVGAAATAVVGVSYLFRHEPEIKDEIPNLIALFLIGVLGMYIRLRRELVERSRTQRAAEAVTPSGAGSRGSCTMWSPTTSA